MESGALGLNQNSVVGTMLLAMFSAKVSLGLSSFMCKMGLKTAVLPTSGGVFRLKLANAWERAGTALGC